MIMVITNFCCLEKQLLDWTYYTLLATSTQDRQLKSLEKRPFISVCHLLPSGFAIRDTSGSHRSQLLKVSRYHLSKMNIFAQNFLCTLDHVEIKSPGAFQLLQLQEDIRKQFKMDGSGPENDLESHIRLNKETLMSSVWKLNVVDIEVTLLHVCQMVSLCFFQLTYLLIIF